MKQIVQGCMALLFALTGFSQTNPFPSKTAVAGGTRAVPTYSKLPLSFEPNRGQTSSQAQWVARGPEYALFLSGHDAVLELSSTIPEKGITGRPKIENAAVRMNLVGAQAAKETAGEDLQTGEANYFTGNNPAKWQREVPMYGRVRLREVYPGIDLVYYGRQGQLEYDFVVAPGADPSKIALMFEGAKAGIGASGDLVLPVDGSDKTVRFDKPTVYQMKNGARQPVAGAFHVARDGKVSFALGSYDRTRELVIDPTLIFEGEIATGNQQTIPQGIAVDAQGEMVITGYTNDLAFPVTTGAYQTNCQVPTSNGEGAGRCGASSAPSAFVTKLSADGTTLIYSTYLHGGGGYEQGQSVVVDAAGDAYVLGSTSSNDFPVTSDAYQTYCQPYSNGNGGFASQCDNFYDGGGTEYTVNGPNLFITKLNPLGTALLYSTFFGGSAGVYPEGIGLDSAGNIYFASFVNGAESPSNLYPNNGQIAFPTTTSGFQTLGNNIQVPALSKLSADGRTLLYSTFLGSEGANGHYSVDQALALGQNGIAFIGGYTQTADFPTTAGSFKPACTLYANDNSYCNTNMGFVAAIDTTKTGAASLVYASYLGGETTQGSNIPEQEVYGLAADASNDLFVTGYTSSANFPTTAGTFQPTCPVAGNIQSCQQTAFLSKINPSGSALSWSTFVGSASTNVAPSYGAAIAFDSKGQVYLYGSGGGAFPQLDPVQPPIISSTVFLTTFTSDGTTLLFGTLFGSSSTTSQSGASPVANGLVVDATGNMYIAGYTNDNGTFGTTPGTYSTPATAGFNRGFFAKFSPLTPQSTTTLAVSPAAASAGQNITFTVAVAGVGQTTPVPTGTVALMNTAVTPAVTIGAITLDETGAGSFSTSTLPMGSYTIVASYSGDSNYEYSQSAPQPLNVTTVLTTNLLQNPGAEFGTLQYWTPGGPGTPQVDSGSFDTGIDPHTGSYDFLGYSGASDSLSQTVSVIQEGITAQQVDGGSVLAQVSFWEQGLNQGDPSDDGFITLTFLDVNGAAISSVNSTTVDSHDLTWANGTGAFPIPTGTRSITYTMNFVRNQGTDLDTFIDDNSLTMAVSNYTGLPVTTTVLTSTPTAPTAGQAVTFSVAVAGLTQTTPAPTGTVTLMNSAESPAAVLGTITLGANATGNFSTGALTAGNYSVTAVYSGDANYAASTSATDTFTVSAVTTTTALTVTPASGAQGTVFTLTATVVNGSGSPVTGGMVNFFDGTKLLASAELVSATGTLTGTATYATRSFTIGSHALRATFAGTGLDQASSTTTAVTINVTGKYATTTALASSGVQGSYALMATVDGPALGVASGSVVFSDSSTSTMLGTVPLTGVIDSFLAGTPIPVGSTTTQIVSADVNGDGKLDLVVANGSGTMVTVLIGNGDGTYTALPSFGTNYNGITGVAVADFNGDGKLDIATANQSTVGIFLGNGDGTFGAETDFANTNVSAGVFPGDFNGDGKIDLAVPDRFNGMTILIGNGDGTFTQPNAAFNVGTSPNYHSAVADFNGDGKLDIAAGNYFNNTVSVVFGNGDGTFQAPVTYATGAAPTATFAGDFNGDGIPDIFLTNADGESISVLLSNGDGTFQPQQTYAVGNNPNGAAVGDLNADGKLDIAVANQNDGTVSILYGNGDGTFQTQQVLTSGAGATAVSIADVNGDGVLDLEAANAGSNTVTVFLNQATATVSLTGVTLPGYASDNVVATYSGDSSFAGSTSNTLNLPSNQFAASTTTLAVTPAAPTVGQSVTFSVTVAGTTQTTTVPTGTVTLMNGAVTPAAVLGTITLGAGGTGSFSTSTLAAGSYSVTAVYSGDANYAASTSAADTFTVSVPAPTATPTATTLAVTSGGSTVTSVAAGSVVTLTASVTVGTAPVTPGQVAFCDASAATCTGSYLLGISQLTAAGTATYKFVPGIGAHSYLAIFYGTNTTAGSASGPTALTVSGKYPTTTAIAKSGAAGNYTLTATTVGTSPHPFQVTTQSVTINLGQSAQNYVLTGTGPSIMQGATYGNYYNTQGSCVTAGSVTTCDLTGTFTSSTSAFAAGTYDFQTVFTGSVSSSVLSQTYYPVGTTEPNDFTYTAFALSTTMTLKLNVTGGGTYAVPIVGDQNYAPTLDGLNFAYTSAVCGGTSLGILPCQQEYVGTVAGATLSGPVTGSVMFELPSASPIGPTGSIAFEDTSNANAMLGTAALGASTQTFSLNQPSGSPLAAGGGAYGVATGDFNGDGFPDTVVENYTANTVSVLLGKGDGTFQPQVSYAVGVQPERVLVADLNGDGFLDLIVANTGSGTISVLLGKGDGTFQAQVTYACGSPVGLGVMDINHDGYPDVVAGDYYDNTMTVLLGNGDGTLRPGVTYATGSTPQTLAEGDFNGDGNIDVAVGNEGGAAVGIFLGNGDGTFQAQVTYPVGNQPMGVQVGDFNSDGKQDLAVSNQGDGTVGVLLGNGDGTFQTQVTYPVGVQPVGIAIADFNGDGIEDITVGNTGQASLTQGVLLGNGDGTFQAQMTFSTGNFPYGVAVADFNGDGLPDMAVANFNDGTATIFLSRVTATATATASVTIGGSSGTTHNVEASYPGDTNFAASMSATTPLVGDVTTVASTTTLGISPAAPTVGQSVMFSVSVAGTTQVTPVATGTVTLTNAAVTPNAVLGTITLGATGSGMFSTSTLAKGSYSVIAAYSGDTNYLASTSSAQSFVVSLATQTITFSAIPNHVLGDPPFALTATSSSGLAVSYAVTSGPATLSGSTVTLTGAGTVTIRASQAGNVDYAAATPVSQSFVVTGAPAPTLATISPAGAVAGAAAMTVTLTGTNFTTTDMVQAGTAALTTTFVNATTLTAVFPASLLANAGTLPISVADTATKETSGTVNFVVAVAPAVVFTGPPTATSDQQPVVTFQLTQPYAVPINCVLTLTFAPLSPTGVVDPAVQFSSGGTTINFTVPAGSTATPPVQFQTGTIAGTATVTLTILTPDGVNVTPAYIVPVVVSLPSTVPEISAAAVSRGTGSTQTLTVTMQGFSNTREVKTAIFHFTPVPGTTLTDPDVTIDVTDIFAAWFGSDASKQYGSTFTYTQPFNLNADPKTIQSVTVTVVNGVGDSVAQTTQ